MHQNNITLALGKPQLLSRFGVVSAAHPLLNYHCWSATLQLGVF